MISLDELLQMDKDERAIYLCRKGIQLKKRLPREYENFILLNPYWAYIYSKMIIKGRWEEAEEIIIKNPEAAVYYAKDIIGGRWKEAEEFIIKSPQYAYFYAYWIKGRWIEAEEYIKKNPVWWKLYVAQVILR